MKEIEDTKACCCGPGEDCSPSLGDSYVSYESVTRRRFIKATGKITLGTIVASSVSDSLAAHTVTLNNSGGYECCISGSLSGTGAAVTASTEGLFPANSFESDITDDIHNPDDPGTSGWQLDGAVGVDQGTGLNITDEIPDQVSGTPSGAATANSDPCELVGPIVTFSGEQDVDSADISGTVQLKKLKDPRPPVGDPYHRVTASWSGSVSGKIKLTQVGDEFFDNDQDRKPYDCFDVDSDPTTCLLSDTVSSVVGMNLHLEGDISYTWTDLSSEENPQPELTETEHIVIDQNPITDTQVDVTVQRSESCRPQET